MDALIFWWNREVHNQATLVRLTALGDDPERTKSQLWESGWRENREETLKTEDGFPLLRCINYLLVLVCWAHVSHSPVDGVGEAPLNPMQKRCCRPCRMYTPKSASKWLIERVVHAVGRSGVETMGERTVDMTLAAGGVTVWKSYICNIYVEVLYICLIYGSLI